MTLHKEGNRTLFLTFLIFSLIIIFSDLFFSFSKLVIILLSFIFLMLWLFLMFFFRKPNRDIKIDDKNIISVADGTVVAIEEVFDDKILKTRSIQVSVFMSPFNIHINWMPVSGIIVQKIYQPGKHLVAFNPKSSLLNEMAVTVVQADNGKQILIRQIAGIMARRIVNYAENEKIFKQGEELGFIKFGSRIDLLLPLDVDIKVKIGQKVTGRKTIIASF
ncbi:MAG: phosphatidylserine decarboxylase family protein [Bacteroidales bacterium]|nr:phosphatidylserine decarboxylase family protein [Bacteroidales bacterium]